MSTRPKASRTRTAILIVLAVLTIIAIGQNINYAHQCDLGRNPTHVRLIHDLHA